MNGYFKVKKELEKSEQQFNAIIHDSEQLSHKIFELRKELVLAEPVIKMIWRVESAKEVAMIFQTLLDENKILTHKEKKNVHNFVKCLCHLFSFQKLMADGSWQELSELTIRNAIQDRE